MREININRQRLGLEDLTFGVGTETQTRAGQQVIITKINAGNLPFDATQSLIEWAQLVNLEELGSMIIELQAIYNNLSAIGNVEDNLTRLNAIEDSLTMLNSIYTNISKIQNVDTNMTKLQTIDTHMSELSAIYTNLVILQAVYNNLTVLNNVEDNLIAINSVNSNLTQLLAIYTQVIPNLTELLQVNDNAVQVAADKITVNTDKLIVAQDKVDISVMKSAVESIYDSFDARFLGAKTSDPVLDNDGNALLDGALYFNTLSHALKVYSLTDTTWYIIPQIYLSGLLDVQLTSITTGDILNWNGTKWVNTRTPKFSTMQLTGGTGTEGTLSWNTDEGTVDIILPNGSILQVGQEGIRKVRNSTASTITNGTVVMFDGTIGNSRRIKVKPFTGGFNEALYVYGIATQDILAGADGIITTEGKIRGINTTGTLAGETWVDGDILYAKPSNAGALTKVVPSDNQLKMIIASVIHAHISGTLEIRFTPINENTWYTKVQADNLLALKVTKVTSTNKAIARYNGITGDLQNSHITIDDSGNIGSGTQTFNGFGGTGFKNYIINGNFEINQRNSTLSSNITTNTSGVFMDMWRYANTANTSSIYLSQDTITYNGTTYKALKATVPTALTNTGVMYTVYTSIEDNTAYKLQNKVFTVSFLAEVNNAGTYSFNIRKYNDDSSITSSFVKLIPLVIGVNKIVITVPADSAYISPKSIDGRGLNICFGAYDSNASNTTEGWVSGNFVTHLNTFKWWNINGGYLKIAQFQLEEGSIATPFEQRPYGLELSLCQRYLPSLKHATFCIPGQAISSTVARFVYIPIVQPRVPPTGLLLTSGNGVVQILNAGGGGIETSATSTLWFSSVNGIVFTGTVASGLTAGDACLGNIDNILFTGGEL